MDGPDAAKLRALPSVQGLLETPQAKALTAAHSHAAVAGAIREALEAARVALQRSVPCETSASALLASAAVALAAAPRLTRVINATGIILHTNLGRAPLAQEAIDAVVAAAGPCNLEYDLQSGGRGSRLQGVEPLLCALTGAEASLAVNNCAAAMLLALSALAQGGDVIVSRGELIEIGGGFRIPDVIQQGGARLVEVGTTNKTRLADYRNAITPETRVLLKVHPSNFRMVGYTEAVARAELARLARERNLICVEDLGSGAVTDLPTLGGAGVDTVQEAVLAGMDLVAFSGDKLLGGPQAGVIVGREAVIARMRRHPLMRALRLDKLTLAALEATLRMHQRGDGARIPTLSILGQDAVALRTRAERLAASLGDLVRIEASVGEAGGGTLPRHPLPSIAVTLTADVHSAEVLAARLRNGAPPVIGRIAKNRVWLDMLTVPDDDLDALESAILRACA